MPQRLLLRPTPTRPPVSIGRLESTYASIFVRRSGDLALEVVAEAHRVLTGGALSGYDVGLTDNGEPSEDGAVFVDDSTSPPADAGQGWGGTVTTEELPGGGLHRHVRKRENRGRAAIGQARVFGASVVKLKSAWFAAGKI